VSSQVKFHFTSAIRYNVSLLVNKTVANQSMYDCPDETGCEYTAWVECAMNKTSTQSQKMAFLTCWDETTDAETPQNETSLEAFAERCAHAACINTSMVKDCHGGHQKMDLLWQAANKFMNKWPQFTKIGGPFHVPHVLIGKAGSTQADLTDWSPGLNISDVAQLNQQLCELKAGLPLCSVMV